MSGGDPVARMLFDQCEVPVLTTLSSAAQVSRPKRLDRAAGIAQRDHQVLSPISGGGERGFNFPPSWPVSGVSQKLSTSTNGTVFRTPSSRKSSAPVDSSMLLSGGGAGGAVGSRAGNDGSEATSAISGNPGAGFLDPGCWDGGGAGGACSSLEVKAAGEEERWGVSAEASHASYGTADRCFFKPIVIVSPS